MLLKQSIRRHSKKPGLRQSLVSQTLIINAKAFTLVEQFTEKGASLFSLFKLLNKEQEDKELYLRLFPVVSHELRTPLTIIVGLGELLADSNLNVEAA